MTSDLYRSIGPVYLSFSRPTDYPTPVAILADGDNIVLLDTQLSEIIRETERYGDIVARQVLGNKNALTKGPWKDLALRYNFDISQHTHGSPGKNATDIKLTVMAMDFFFQGITHFVLISNDKDYIPLVQRLQKGNCYVIGIGHLKKDHPLRLACNSYIVLTKKGTKLSRSKDKPNDTKTRKQAKQKNTSAPNKTDLEEPLPQLEKNLNDLDVSNPIYSPELTKKILHAFSNICKEQCQETVFLVDVAKELKKLYPYLRPKDYGKTMLLFVIKERTDLFSFQEVEVNGSKLDLMIRK